MACPGAWVSPRCPFLFSGLLPGWGVTRGCGVLGGRRKGRVVRVSGGVRGCGFFYCVAYEGGLLVEWGADCAGVVRSVRLCPRSALIWGLTPLGGNVKGVRVTLVRWDRSKV